MAYRRKQAQKRVSARVYFCRIPNEKGEQQSCVYVECGLEGTRVGPVWGHSDQSIRMAMAKLTEVCECPGKFHFAEEFKGQRVVSFARRRL